MHTHVHKNIKKSSYELVFETYVMTRYTQPYLLVLFSVPSNVTLTPHSPMLPY